MTIKGYLIKAEDNSKTAVELPEGESQCLKALQEYCGGYVEAQHDAEGKATFWLNEDGKILKLPGQRVSYGVLVADQPAVPQRGRPGR